MNKSSNLDNLKECKIKASILLKSLYSADDNIANKAAKKFKKIAEFSQYSVAEIRTKDIKRKHALAVIALEKGFDSWTDLKSQIHFIIGGFLNKWFATYEEAKAEQKIAGGFLLPYKHQFFICEATYIKQLGLNPNDPDWKLINKDWAKPTNKQAWQRLYKKWAAIMEKSRE